MKHLFIWVLWAVVIVGVCIAADQILLRYSMDAPIYRAAQTFYQDFRGRIIQFVKKEDHRLEVVKESWPPTIPPAVQEKIKPLLPPPPEPSGYVYSDKVGALHMTTRLAEVPKEYRATARPLQK